MEYITLHLDSTNEVEQWYVRHNFFIVLLHSLCNKTKIVVPHVPLLYFISTGGAFAPLLHPQLRLWF